MAVEQNERGKGRMSGEKIAGHLIAEDHDVALLGLIQSIEVASLLHRKEADSVVLRFGAGELAAGTGELADGVDIASGKDGRDGANVWRFFADIEIILVGEPVLAGGSYASLDGWSAAGKDHHDVFAILRKTALVTGSEAFT